MNLNDPGCMGLREVRREKCGEKLAGEPGVNHVFFNYLIGQAVQRCNEQNRKRGHDDEGPGYQISCAGVVRPRQNQFHFVNAVDDEGINDLVRGEE